MGSRVGGRVGVRVGGWPGGLVAGRLDQMEIRLTSALVQVEVEAELDKIHVLMRLQRNPYLGEIMLF